MAHGGRAQVRLVVALGGCRLARAGSSGAPILPGAGWCGVGQVVGAGGELGPIGDGLLGRCLPFGLGLPGAGSGA